MSKFCAFTSVLPFCFAIRRKCGHIISGGGDGGGGGGNDGIALNDNEYNTKKVNLFAIESLPLHHELE